MKPNRPAAEQAGRIATVVVHQWVKPGCVQEYEQWQEGLANAARAFPGFLGKEICKPVAGVQDSWVVILRFASADALKQWLSSEVRSAWLARGQPYFSRPDKVSILAGDSAGETSVAAVASNRVRAGCERDFQAWNQRMMIAEAGFAGYQGTLLFPPVPGLQEEWVALIRFDTAPDLQAWLDSKERAQLLHEGNQYLESVSVEKMGAGFGRWFSPGGTDQAALTPVWKQTLAILLGLYPTVFILTILLTPEVLPLPLAGGLLVSNILSCFVLAYAVMPVVTKAVGFWLKPSRDLSWGINVAGVLLIAGVLGLMLALFLGLS